MARRSQPGPVRLGRAPSGRCSSGPADRSCRGRVVRSPGQGVGAELARVDGTDPPRPCVRSSPGLPPAPSSSRWPASSRSPSPVSSGFGAPDIPSKLHPQPQDQVAGRQFLVRLPEAARLRGHGRTCLACPARDGVCRAASVRRETAMSDEGGLFDRVRDAVTGDRRERDDEGRRDREEDESGERLSTDDLAGAPTSRRSAGGEKATAAREGTTPVAAPDPDVTTGRAAAGSGMEQREAESAPPVQPGGEPTDEVPSLFPATEARGFLDRWGEVQSRFVDDPKRAVQDGDALVAEVMQTLAASFARHKADLEGQWNIGDAATDDLRQAFQRYRAFFQRLLSA